MIAPAMIPNKQFRFNAVAQVLKILRTVADQKENNLIEDYFQKSDAKKIRNAIREIDDLFSKRAKDMATEYQNASEFVEGATEMIVKAQKGRKAAYRG